MADEEVKNKQTTGEATQMADAEKLRHKKITEERFAKGDLLFFNDDEWLVRHTLTNGDLLKLVSGLPNWGSGNDVNISLSPSHYTPSAGSIAGHFGGIDTALGSVLTHGMFTANGIMIRTSYGNYSILLYSTSPLAYGIPIGDSGGHITSWVSGSGAIMDSDFSSNGLMYRLGAGSYTVLSCSTSPGAYYVPRADANGKLDTWISDAASGAKGKIKLANCLSGTADAPAVTAIKESGGQVLTIGAIADGALLMRSGTSIIGSGS